ncbi:hypothetical protein [Sporosarcina sp. YIM B06819]|uniref:hypothetical protein n=1 Tax=Sporosarcina sp. YIM B06819 TaxID=3081769 RepID=UPI00298CF293|nr:hypothetical protein [Sporosarcina sp. YIM B06819]
MQEHEFGKLIGGLKESKIGLFLSGNQFIEGMLLDVKQDHLVVVVDQKVMYVALQHIKALSKNAKDVQVMHEKVPYLNRNYMVDIWKDLRYNWVTINSLSHQKVFGVLSKVAAEYIMVIHNAELLYIANAHITDMYSEIADEQIILLNQIEQLASPRKLTSIMLNELSEMNERVVVEQLSLTNSNEAEKSSEALNVEKVAGERIENENDAIEHPDSYLEKVIHGFAPQISEDIQHAQHQEEQVAVQQLQQTNDNTSKALAIENLVGVVKRIASDKQESPEVYVETANVLQMEKQDEYESSSHEQRFNLAEYQSRLNEKRILLSEWNTIMTDHRTMLSHNNPEKENKREMSNHGKNEVESDILDNESIAVKKKRRKKRLNRLTHPILETKSMIEVDADIEVLDGKPESAEITGELVTSSQLSQEEQQKRLKMQYHALMLHYHALMMNAAGNTSDAKLVGKTPSHLPVRRTSSEEMVEKQYRSLMKHAEKMYHQLRDL